MPLVDYSSDSSDSASRDSGPPPPKRRKDSAHDSGASPDPDGRRPSMPPLPSAFHDLYASTVRQSVHDDPSLHHGRKRQIPHVVGNWPTHLYIEWHPTTTQHDLLVQLITAIETKLGNKVKLHNFLTSDLGSPLPLHISLSRPIALSTAEKDDFLDKTTNAIQSINTGVFHVSPSQLKWFKSPDSDRTFLVLQVTSAGGLDHQSLNPELTSLLTRCNGVVTSFNQPALYQTEKAVNWDAFHVSIGWTFDVPDDEVTTETVDLFKQSKFKDMQSWKIEVPGVKVKIGNVVSHVPLDGVRRKSQSGHPGSIYV